MFPVNLLQDAAAAEAMVQKATRKERRLPYDTDRAFDLDLIRRIERASMVVNPAGELEAADRALDTEEKQHEEDRVHMETRNQAAPPRANLPHVEYRSNQSSARRQARAVHPQMGHILDIKY